MTDPTPLTGARAALAQYQNSDFPAAEHPYIARSLDRLIAYTETLEAERAEGWRVAAEQTRLERDRAERAEATIATMRTWAEDRAPYGRLAGQVMGEAKIAKHLLEILSASAVSEAPAPTGYGDSITFDTDDIAPMTDLDGNELAEPDWHASHVSCDRRLGCILPESEAGDE